MNSPNRINPTILVTNAARGSAIAIIRSLGRRGWRVIAGDSDPGSPGFRSRYAKERFLYPAPEESPREYLQTLLRVARERQVDLIIPVNDAAIFPLSQGREQFKGLCQLALPEAHSLEIVTNKLQTLALAQRLGVAVPRTRLVHTVQEAMVHGPALGWPVVLKPQSSRLYHRQGKIVSFTVSYAQDEHGLATQMEHFEGQCPVLLQEYWRGEGYGVEMLTYQGRPLAAFQHKRLRETPLTGGASAFRESVPLDLGLYDQARRLLEALSWTGLAMVEFKVGDRGALLMEINGRVWGSLPLAVHSGMDFPRHLAELYLFGPPANGVPPTTSYRQGVRSRNLELDLAWMASVLLQRRRYSFLRMPTRLQGVTALLGLLNPANKFDIIQLEDPMPGWAEIRKIAVSFWSRLRGTRPVPGNRIKGLSPADPVRALATLK